MHRRNEATKTNKQRNLHSRKPARQKLTYWRWSDRWTNGPELALSPTSPRGRWASSPGLQNSEGSDGRANRTVIEEQSLIASFRDVQTRESFFPVKKTLVFSHSPHYYIDTEVASEKYFYCSKYASRFSILALLPPAVRIRDYSTSTEQFSGFRKTKPRMLH